MDSDASHKCHLFIPHPRAYFFIAFRERGREREKQQVRDKHQMLFSPTCSDQGSTPRLDITHIWTRGHTCLRQDQGSNPQPRYVPWLDLSTFQLWNDAPTNWAILDRAWGWSSCMATTPLKKRSRNSWILWVSMIERVTSFFQEPRKHIIQDLVQEKYLVYWQVPNSDPPCYDFLWGQKNMLKPLR